MYLSAPSALLIAMNAKLAIAPAIATLALLAGCASTGGGADTKPPSGTNADPTTMSAPVSSPPASDTSAADATDAPTTARFGQAFTWDDGLTVKVSRPRRFTPSDVAAVEGKGQAMRFTFIIVNKSNKPFDPTGFYATLQSGNAEAGTVFDVDHGLEGSPQTKVLPGREVKFDEGWMAKNPNDLVLEVAPSFDYDSAIFTS